jgi:hypothetical protein
VPAPRLSGTTGGSSSTLGSRAPSLLSHDPSLFTVPTPLAKSTSSAPPPRRLHFLWINLCSSHRPVVSDFSNLTGSNLCCAALRGSQISTLRRFQQCGSQVVSHGSAKACSQVDSKAFMSGKRYIQKSERPFSTVRLHQANFVCVRVNMGHRLPDTRTDCQVHLNLKTDRENGN